MNFIDSTAKNHAKTVALEHMRSILRLINVKTVKMDLLAQLKDHLNVVFAMMVHILTQGHQSV